ncbi:hypothetical protein KAW55_06420 [bacterium]|nr:hypothetical protein [bacterium]
MTKAAKEIVVVLIIVPVLFFSWAYNIKRLRKRREPKAPVTAGTDETPEAQTLSEGPRGEVRLERRASSDEVEAQRERFSLSWGRDPFVLSGGTAQAGKRGVSLGGFSLNGVSWKGKVGVAIVNDFIVKEGDVFEGYKVIKILKKGIVLEKGGKRYTLGLEE